MASQFLRPLDEYQRDIDFIRGYVEQASFYLAKVTGKDQAYVTAWLKSYLGKGGEGEFKPPVADVAIRDTKTGDRKMARMSMLKLFDVIKMRKLITSPSLTMYLNPEEKRSLLSIFIDENIAKRGKVKKEMFVAKNAGDHVLAMNKDNEQTSLKTRNNGLSGAHSSPYTILYNKSTHSTLTSICRSATSYGNANNEKMMSGTRHYWSPAVVINNITSICKLTDFDAFQRCLDEYNIHIPSVKETMDCIYHSTKLFWRNSKAMDGIREYVDTLSPVERAAVVYIGDLYHLAIYNDALAREFIGHFIYTDTPPAEESEVGEIESMLDGDLKMFISLLCVDIINGREFSDIKKTDMSSYLKIMGVCKKTYLVMNKYSNLIRELFSTKNVPASIASLPNTIRRVGLVSDTDSTMATAQWWSDWYVKDTPDIKIESAVADAVIYMSVQSIAHLMARMSANMGVERSKIFRYAMKNEYKFSAFSLTNKSKHYFASITSREGNAYKEPELEVKGVGLRTSNIPDLVMLQFREMLEDICAFVTKGQKFELIPLLKRAAAIEHEIKNDLLSGGYKYLKTCQIRTRDGYSKPESSVYIWYEMWEEVFAEKYGHSPAPPVGCIDVKVELPNKTAINEWLKKIEDRALADRMKHWLNKIGRTKLTKILLPEAILASVGIPKEILLATDIRKVVHSSVEPFYYAFETLGVYMIDDSRTKMLSDYY